ARESGRPTVLMVVALNDVPRLIHTYGRATLDFLLAAVAERASGALRDYDLVARLGDGQLGVLLPETDQSVSEALAETLRSAIGQQPFAVPTTRDPVSASVSVAVSNLPLGQPPRQVMAET